MKWCFSNKRFFFALKVVFGQYPSLPVFPQCRNRRSECLQTSTKGVTLAGTSETSCGWCGSWATKNEPYQTLPFAPLIQANLWVCWWKKRRRKASTGHRSMDLQWLLTCFNKYEQDAPPLHNNPAFKTHPISFPSDVIPAENIKENLFIRSDPLVAFDMKAGGDGVNSEGIKERAV